MAYYDDEDYDDADDEEWMQDDVSVLEPFASGFRLTRTRRYDLQANLARAMNLPKRDFAMATERFLDGIYEMAAEDFDAGIRLNAEEAKALARRAIRRLDWQDLCNVVIDLGWWNNLYLQPRKGEKGIAFGSAEERAREALAHRLAGRIEVMLRRLRPAA